MTRAPLLPLLPLLLAACGGTPSDRAATAPTAGDVAGIRVEEAVVHPTEAALTLSFSGDVEGSRDASLAAPLGGYVESVDVKEGQAVRAGQVLARIDATTYTARRDQAEAQATQAAAELARVQGMGDLATPQQLLAAQTAARVAEANLKLAQTQLSRALLSAPFDGVVSLIALDPGEVAPPASPFCRLVRLDPVKVTFAVADRDAPLLHPDMPATVTVEARPGALQGRVSAISAVADARTRAFKGEVEVSNPDGRLSPGMIARVTVASAPLGPSLVIPQDAVVTRLQDVGVFVDEGGIARWRTLELGEVLRDAVRVTGGLSDGEHIVTTGHRELVDGDRLLVTRSGTCCTDGRVTW